jgi:cyclophilin family peptidyl-prolyl cis-trans isomerase
MKNVAVIGAGTMGNGIAHTFAQFGYKVSLIDVAQTSIDKGIATITKNLDRQVAKESISEAQKAETLNNITTFTSIAEGVKDEVYQRTLHDLDPNLKSLEQNAHGETYNKALDEGKSSEEAEYLARQAVKAVRDEYAKSNPLLHEAGVLSMARSSRFNSASSQFFIVHEEASFLNNSYAGFGKVTIGLEVIDTIANLETDANDKPVEKVVIEFIRIKK